MPPTVSPAGEGPDLPGPLTPALTGALRHLTPGSGEPLTLTSALTGQALSTVAGCAPADLLEAVHRARAAHRSWAQAPYGTRRTVLRRLVRLLHAHRAILLPLAQHTCALSTHDAEADLRSAARTRPSTFAHSGGRHLPRLGRRLPAPPLSAPVLSCATDDARPFTALLETALPALAAGSCVLTHVTGHTAAVTAYMVALARQAGLPPAVWQAVLGPRDDAYALLTEHTDGRLTGCCPRRGSAAEWGRDTAAALVAVRHDARLPSALRAAFYSCFTTAGRRCTSTPLIAVHTRHYELFTERFAAAAARTSLQPPLASDAVTSPLASTDHARALQSYLKSGLTADAAVLHDGGYRPDLAPGMHGRIVVSHPHTWTLDAARIPPGPLAVLVPFSAWAEVLDLARSTGRHLNVHTTTPLSQLAPQFATLPAQDITINRPAPRQAPLLPHSLRP